MQMLCACVKRFACSVDDGANSFSTGIVPEALKIAKVVPIFKGGNSEDIANYRPISMLPYFSKILEKVNV